MSNSKSTLLKATVFLLVPAVVAVSYLLSDLSATDLLNQSERIKDWIAAMGYAAPVIFTLTVALLTAIGLPRLLFCTLAGMVFGFTWGFIWSHLGTLLGAYLTFLFARWSGRDFIRHKFPKISSISKSTPAKGWKAVLLMRQLPISGLYNDILLGISKVSQKDFWIGSFIGFIPLGIPATLIGAGALQLDLRDIAQYLGLATVSFLLLSFSLNMFVGQLQKAKRRV